MSKMRELNGVRLNWVFILLAVSALYFFADCLYFFLIWHEHSSASLSIGGLLDYLRSGLPNSILPIIISWYYSTSFYKSLTLIWSGVCLEILQLSASIPLAFLAGRWLSGINARHGLLASVLAYIITSLIVIAISTYLAFRI
jgi:hypothetical protein